MTERPLSISTQIATPIQTAFNSTPSISAHDAPTFTESVDEEPYTIKCICDFSDDDGNTIYCETCDTWQHIECFYPGRVADASRADFDHSCADCKPRRELDKNDATERQRSQRRNKINNDTGDKKTKRPPSKSHKKKPKPSELQVNGHDHDALRNGSPQDQHAQSKKPKGHRSNQSINSQIKRSPPYNARPSNAHPPSPAHTPPDLPNNFQYHSYSEHFSTLYDDDPSFEQTHTNSFASLTVTNSLAQWLTDSEKLREDAGVKDREDVFQFLRVPVESLSWPKLQLEHKRMMVNGTSLQWRHLIILDGLGRDNPVGEVNGRVGFQKDYCNDIENRWQESPHPRPFVFFHPRLPLFIDTRQEGSQSRHVRRSCRANTAFDTFIANSSEYHFWLISDRQIAANEQITIPWDFRFPAHCRSRFLHLLNLADEDEAPFDGADTTDEEYVQLSSIIDVVLSDHGGCACELGNDCAFARFHRTYFGRSHTQSNGVKSKKGRKPKQSHVSPTSTGHATNSRAPSEGQVEQYDDDDRRSLTGSSRSKPNSRDLTPLHGVSESNGILTETSEREKRKLAALEDTFRKLEKEKEQPARKKKRVSDGAANPVPHSTSQSKSRQRSVAPRMSISQASNTNGSRGRQYADVGTSGRQSGSPSSAISPNATARSPDDPASRRGSIPDTSRQASAIRGSIYTDGITQTDNVANAWYNNAKPSPAPQRPIIPLAKRLLKNRQKLRLARSVQHVPSYNDAGIGTSPTVSMDLDTPVLEERHHPESPTDSRGRHASIASSTPSVEVPVSTDIHMTDAPAMLIGNTIKPPPPPWPGHSNIIVGPHSRPGQRSPDLRVQMPPAPSFSTPNMSGTLSASVTPSSAAGSIVQSPFGTSQFPNAFPASTVNGLGQHSSPLRKKTKLSLSDYNKLKMNPKRTESPNKASAGSSPTTAPAVLKPSLSTIEEAKVPGVLEGSAIIESPIMEKKVDPMDAVTETSAQNNTLSEQTNGML